MVVIDEHYINRLLMRWGNINTRTLTPDDSVVYVTELSSPCARRVWYSRRYPPEATEHEALRLMGEAIHELLEEGLRRDGWETEIPVAINVDGVTVRGRVDAARPDEDTGEYTDVIEIKTVDEIPQHPKPEHVHQAAIYAGILGAGRYHIVYISRRDGRVRVFSNEAPDHYNTIIAAKEAARELIKTIRSETPPPPNRGPWCSYCPYKWRCWGRR